MRPYFLLCSSLLFLCAAYLPAQPLNWPNKIDPTLRTRIQAEGPSEFLVVLSAQADVSDANKLTNKEEKGRYVYETLLQLAESTQGSVRKVLNDAQAPMQSFWVINALWSKGDINLVERLAQMPEVERVENNPVLHLCRPQLQFSRCYTQPRQRRRQLLWYQPHSALRRQRPRHPHHGHHVRGIKRWPRFYLRCSARCQMDRLPQHGRRGWHTGHLH
ncbi:MAG: hypothetical protein LCH81_14010 [Bacteroidetes bacterium]|nr:hypothetical protein [Bacteroidota bacterium]